MSNSAFVAFLDADDEWLPQKLEHQINLLKQDPTLGLVCSFCSRGERESEKRAALAAAGIPRSGRMFRHLVGNCFVFTPTVVVRRRCLEQVGLFNESLAVSEDFDLWLRIAARWKIAVIPEILAVTYTRPGSLSASIPAEERLRNGVNALEHVQSTCQELSPAEGKALRAALAERIYFYGSFLLTNGARGPARSKLVSALKLCPTYWRAFAKLGLSFLPMRALGSVVGLKRKLTNGRLSRSGSQLAQRDASSI